MGFKSLGRRSRLQTRAVATFIFIALGFLVVAIKTKIEVYDPLGYIIGSIALLRNGPVQKGESVSSTAEDKMLVIPAMESVDMSWVAHELPDWQRSIYIVNPSEPGASTDSLVQSINKGREAMAYLTYIIDNYNGTIPSTVAFLHSHRGGFFEAWHVDTPTHDNVAAMRMLNLDAVQDAGYVNLRCNWNPGCSTRRRNGHVTGKVWAQLMGRTSTPVFNDKLDSPGALEGIEGYGDREELDENAGLMVFATCCAQFAVSREQIYRRPLSDYVNIRNWLVETDLDDAHSGRVMEYMWHIIFGREAMHCPDEKACYCKVYGRC